MLCSPIRHGDPADDDFLHSNVVTYFVQRNPAGWESRLVMNILCVSLNRYFLSMWFFDAFITEEKPSFEWLDTKLMPWFFCLWICCESFLKPAAPTWFIMAMYVLCSGFRLVVQHIVYSITPCCRPERPVFVMIQPSQSSEDQVVSYVTQIPPILVKLDATCSSELCYTKFFPSVMTPLGSSVFRPQNKNSIDWQVNVLCD